MAVIEADLHAALAAVPVPGGGTLGASGRIVGLALQGGRASASIRVEPGEVATFEPVRLAAEAALRALPGVARALVALTAETTTGETAAGPAAAAAAPSAGPPAALAQVAHVVAVASGKGGVGKSTTACNLAVALGGLGLRVGLLDADVHGPSAPRLFGLAGRPRVRDGRRLEPMQGFGVRVMSMGLVVDEETAMIWRGPMVMAAITQLMTEVAWGALDVLVVDMPPGTGDAQLALAQGTRLSGAVIVSTPQDLALLDARRGIAMFARVGVPILGLVENMGVFVCPTCGSAHPIFGRDGVRAEAARLDVPFLGSVPLTLALRMASDAGRPVAAIDPEGTEGRCYRAIAEAVWRGLAGPAAGQGGRHPRGE